MFQIMIYIVHIVQTDLSSCITIHTCHCARVCVSWQAHGPGPDNDSKVHVALYRGTFGSSHGKERGNGVTQSQFVNG